MMPVGSVLELYTSILGWNLYCAIWSLLVNSGVVLIPFIVTIVDVLLDTRDSPREISSDGLIRILETRIYSMMFVVFFAAQPMINVHISKTTYTNYRCQATSSGVLEKTVSEKSFGDSGSTLDKKGGLFSAMIDSRIPKVPLWWYLVTKLNHAIAQAAKQELPCQADLRTMASNLNELEIHDKILKDELKDFYSDCWYPAVNQFGSERLPESELPNKFRGGAIYDDIAWPGSEFLLERPGYYSSLKTSKELSPDYFPYQESRDAVKIPASAAGANTGGYPTCHEWWLGYPSDGYSLAGEERGLRSRLLSNLKAEGISDEASSWWNYWTQDKFSSAKDRDDALIKAALFNFKGNVELNLGSGLSGGNGGLASDSWSAVKTGIAFLGAALTSIPDAIETEGYRKLAPAIHAIVLMIFIVALPILMLVGSFNLGNLVALSVFQFTIVFWGFLFAFAAWLDNFLLDSLFSVGDDGRTVLGLVMPDATHNPDAMAISWVVRMCYYLLPLLFTIFLGVVGVKSGDALNRGTTQLGSSAAKRGNPSKR